MILGIGTDIVEIERIRQSMEKSYQKFVQRILTSKEYKQFQQLNSKQQPAFLAKRFAAKEAISKTLGTGIGRGVSFQHIVIEHDEYGKPIARLTDVALERAKHLSNQQPINLQVAISDEQQYAVAYAILETLIKNP